MEELLWNVFKKSGNINDFLTYKEYKNKVDLYKSLDQYYTYNEKK